MRLAALRSISLWGEHPSALDAVERRVLAVTTEAQAAAVMSDIVVGFSMVRRMWCQPSRSG
jgi:hypothetical protein